MYKTRTDLTEREKRGQRRSCVRRGGKDAGPTARPLGRELFMTQTRERERREPRPLGTASSTPVCPSAVVVCSFYTSSITCSLLFSPIEIIFSPSISLSLSSLFLFLSFFPLYLSFSLFSLNSPIQIHGRID